MQRWKHLVAGWLVVGVLTFAVVPHLRGQAEGTRGRPLALQAEVKMILVPVTVIDRKGAAINGLAQDQFTVLDDKVPQKIVSFSAEDAPCSIGLVLDLSGSMRGALKPAKEALTEFLGVANGQDEFLLLGVTTKPVVYQVGSIEDVGEFTSDTATIQNSIQIAPLGGSTALVDTVYTALRKMHAARHPRRALVIVSDGMDNHSRHTRQELIRLAEEADVQIYTIAIDSIRHEKKAIQQIEQRRGLNYLDDLADKTGGVHFTIRNHKDASAAAARIGLAIRNQYLIGYQPHALDSSGKWHRVQVKLDSDQVSIYSRTGYYAH